MSDKSKKEKRITVRLTNVRHSELTIYAKAHNITLTKAVEELIEEGWKAKNDPLAKKSDIEKLLSETKQLQEQQELTKNALIYAIQNQPIAVQEQLEASKKDEEKSKGFLARLLNH